MLKNSFLTGEQTKKQADSSRGWTLRYIPLTHPFLGRRRRTPHMGVNIPLTCKIVIPIFPPIRAMSYQKNAEAREASDRIPKGACPRVSIRTEALDCDYQWLEAHHRYTRMVHFREGWRSHPWRWFFASCVMQERHLPPTATPTPIKRRRVLKTEITCWPLPSSAVRSAEHTVTRCLSGLALKSGGE